MPKEMRVYTIRISRRNPRVRLSVEKLSAIIIITVLKENSTYWRFQNGRDKFSVRMRERLTLLNHIRMREKRKKKNEIS